MAQQGIDRRAASVAAAPPDGERRPGLRAIGSAAVRIVRPIVGRGGGGVLARLKADWPTIVGDAVAAHAWPEVLSRDSTLRLRTSSGAALELQHRTPLLIERINLFFGRSVVARIVLVQGPLPLAAPPLVRGSTDSPNPAAETALAAQVADIADPGLRAALAGLGRLVRGRGNR